MLSDFRFYLMDSATEIKSWLSGRSPRGKIDKLQCTRKTVTSIRMKTKEYSEYDINEERNENAIG